MSTLSLTLPHRPHPRHSQQPSEEPAVETAVQTSPRQPRRPRSPRGRAGRRRRSGRSRARTPRTPERTRARTNRATPTTRRFVHTLVPLRGSEGYYHLCCDSPCAFPGECVAHACEMNHVRCPCCIGITQILPDRRTAYQELLSIIQEYLS